MRLAYTDKQIDLVSANSGELIEKKERIGFVNTDCSIIRNIIAGIMRFTNEEENIFADEDIVGLNNLYTRLTYGR